ncbi:phosphate acetyltransferase, partial [Levilactobacillus brevis]|nr:phosphate acetyltransferase [Levilactobacillus brevis]
MELFDSLKQKINGQNKTIVFPEGEDERVLGAASRLVADGLVKAIVLGKQSQIETTATNHAIDLSQLTILDPAQMPSDQHQAMLDALVERRKGKNTPEQAAEMLKDPNYVGTMMVYMGQADGMVSGAVHATGDTVRPALQIIKTKA